MSVGCGVYSIECLPTGKCYVGSSIDMRRRIREHHLKLKQGKHHSPHMQRSYDRHGKESFRDVILERATSRGQLMMCEQYWIDKLKPAFNVRPYADGRAADAWSDDAFARSCDRSFDREILRTLASYEIIEEWKAAKRPFTSYFRDEQITISRTFEREVTQRARAFAARQNQAESLKWLQRSRRRPVGSATISRQ